MAILPNPGMDAVPFTTLTSAFVDDIIENINALGTGYDVSINTDGTLKSQAVRDALGSGNSSFIGWEAFGNNPNTVTHNGNRSYNLVFNSVNLTSDLAPGMRLRTTRTVAAPTQCTSLNGTTQYYSRTSANLGSTMVFTDDCVVSAWIKLNNYGSGLYTIASRYNGTNGWRFAVEGSTGKLFLIGHNGGSGNFSQVGTYQSIPTGKWVHVTAQLDMSSFTVSSTTSYAMIDGVNVPAFVSRVGTNPTALTQGGNLEIGSENGGTNLFPGKIAQVAIYNSKVSQSTITASMNQTIAGNESNLISAYSFNNTINDLNTTSANNLTANASAVATNADSPFGGQANGTISPTLDYGIIQSVSFSTNTTVVLQAPEGCTIPTTGGVNSTAYSSTKSPYNFPAQQNKWRISTVVYASVSGSFPGLNQWANTNVSLNIPVGEYKVGLSSSLLQISANVSGGVGGFWTVQPATPTNAYYLYPIMVTAYNLASNLAALNSAYKDTNISLSSATIYNLYASYEGGSGSVTWSVRGDRGLTEIFADNAYL